MVKPKPEQRKQAANDHRLNNFGKIDNFFKEQSRLLPDRKVKDCKMSVVYNTYV